MKAKINSDKVMWLCVNSDDCIWLCESEPRWCHHGYWDEWSTRFIIIGHAENVKNFRSTLRKVRIQEAT